MARWQLGFAGADVVVDEEDHVGHRIATGLREMLAHVRGDESGTTTVND